MSAPGGVLEQADASCGETSGEDSSGAVVTMVIKEGGLTWLRVSGPDFCVDFDADFGITEAKDSAVAIVTAASLRADWERLSREAL